MSKRTPIGPKLRFAVLRRDKHRCVYCGAAPDDGETVLQLDHVRPVSDGGTNTFDNLVTACRTCNIGKGAYAVTQALNFHVYEDESDGDAIDFAFADPSINMDPAV